jgi:hypothetical protein
MLFALFEDKVQGEFVWVPNGIRIDFTTTPLIFPNVIKIFTDPIDVYHFGQLLSYYAKSPDRDENDIQAWLHCILRDFQPSSLVRAELKNISVAAIYSYRQRLLKDRFFEALVMGDLDTTSVLSLVDEAHETFSILELRNTPDPFLEPSNPSGSWLLDEALSPPDPLGIPKPYRAPDPPRERLFHLCHGNSYIYQRHHSGNNLTGAWFYVGDIRKRGLLAQCVIISGILLATFTTYRLKAAPAVYRTSCGILLSIEGDAGVARLDWTIDQFMHVFALQVEGIMREWATTSIDYVKCYVQQVRKNLGNCLEAQSCISQALEDFSDRKCE